MNSPAPAVSPDGWGWLETGIVSGDLLVPGNHARSWMFDTVRADPDGPTTRRLLAFTTDGRVSVRRTTFELLVGLSFGHSDWPLVADAAESALSDVDLPLRRTAAALLVRIVEPDRAMAVLNASTDPVVRIALLHAILRPKIPGYQEILEPLRSDPVPVIRLLANIAVFSEDDSAAWPALDAAIRADLEALTWLAEHGGLTVRQHKQLRSLFSVPGFGQLESGGALWLHEGPAVADELLEVLPNYLSDDLYGPKALRVFAAMGSHARPILDRLDRFATSRRRAGFNVGDIDAELRSDETLLAATIAAREQIAG